MGGGVPADHLYRCFDLSFEKNDYNEQGSRWLLG